jgi:hypothetical protein
VKDILVETNCTRSVTNPCGHEADTLGQIREEVVSNLDGIVIKRDVAYGPGVLQ